MVGRVSPQTPESGSHQHCSESPRAACYSLPTLFAARTKQLTPSSAPRGAKSLLFSAASAYFPSPRGCTLHHSRGSDAQTCERANSFVYRGLVPLCSLLRALALCFQWFAASFCKTPGVGVCPQTLRLTSTRCRLFACALAPLSGPSEGRAQSAARYPPLTTHSPVPAHSVLNSWLSCPEAGQP